MAFLQGFHPCTWPKGVTPFGNPNGSSGFPAGFQRASGPLAGHGAEPHPFPVPYCPSRLIAAIRFSPAPRIKAPMSTAAAESRV